MTPPSPPAGESSLYSNVVNAPRVALAGVNAVPVPGKYCRSTGNVVNPAQFVYITQYDLAVPPGRWTFQYMINYTTAFSGTDNQYVGWGIYLSNSATWMSTLATWSENGQSGSRWGATYLSVWIPASGQDDFFLVEGAIEFSTTSTIRLACNTNDGGAPTVTIRRSSSSHVMPVTA
ncbi:hypothetical protein [Streptosporangium sp. NPDC051022]|uniref:hypothetical protein n=1 Tax=Streptosporangium sp. NPDC051022 TaxID=3155752 RepID=UPI00343795FB